VNPAEEGFGDGSSGPPGELAVVGIDDFSRIVSAIYASALTPENWIVAMADVRRTLDAQSAGLLLADESGRSIKSASLAPEAQKTYLDYYRQIDYVLDAVEEGPVGLIRSGQPLIALKARSEFDADWMRPHQMDDGLFVRLTTGSMPTCFLAAAPKRSEPFDTAERVKLMSALVPHLQQALRTQSHLEDFAQGATDIARAVDSVRHGIAVVGPGSVVIHLNSAAERILKCGDGLCIRSGSVEASSASANAELRRSIAGALLEHEASPRGGNSFLCRRPSGKRPYVIHVLPFSPTTENVSVTRALVVLVDPEQQLEPPTQLLRRVYGLTNAEADVALRVLRGDGLKPICEELSLSMATVKTHLQHVFDKTDTHRQAELVRLLLTIIP
jgi:DNA-binding CsgD family transcriptional regulator/PAS domain-containing protein